MPSPADAILKLHGEHQVILGALSDDQAHQIGLAYEQARKEISTDLQALWEKASIGTLTPAQQVQMLRNSEMISQIDGHLGRLQQTALGIQDNAWTQGAQLGLSHANAELALGLSDFGGPGVVGASVFGRIDNVAVDLGMTAAVNETQNLAGKLRLDLQRELQTGVLKGEGIRDLTKRLDQPHLLGGAKVASGNRAELIARYSTIKGHNAGADHAYNEAAKSIPGLQKEWIVTRDERTCPHCLAHHGEVVSVDAEFDQSRSFAKTPPAVYGGTLEYPPLHPRCRCTIVSWHPRWAGLSDHPPEAQQEQAQELAQQAGFPPKSFPIPNPPKPGSLRASRVGRSALRANQIASVPKNVRNALMQRFRSCWLGGGPG